MSESAVLVDPGDAHAVLIESSTERYTTIMARSAVAIHDEPDPGMTLVLVDPGAGHAVLVQQTVAELTAVAVPTPVAVVKVYERGVTGAPGTAGTPGTPGAPGAVGQTGASGGVIAQTYTQSMASDLWVIVHSVDHNPDVTLIDNNGDVVEADVSYPDASTVHVSWFYPSTGSAVLI